MEYETNPGVTRWQFVCQYWNTVVDGIPFRDWLRTLDADIEAAVDKAREAYCQATVQPGATAPWLKSISNEAHMNALLKQTGVESYCSPTLHNVVIKKGQTIRVAAAVAEYLKTLTRFSDNDELEIPYYTEIEEGSVKEVTYDFTSARVQTMVASRPRDTDAIADAARNQEPEVPETKVEEPETPVVAARTGSDEDAGDDDQEPPTREELDAKLAELPAEMSNDEIQVFLEDAMDYFGNLFTGADAENVKARAKKAEPDAKTEAKAPEAAAETPAAKTVPAKKAPVVRKSQRA